MVRDFLLSKDASKVKLATKRIAAWQTRGRVPLAIQATCAITNSTSRQQLALALLRAISAIIDNTQKGEFASSALKIAETLGLKTYLVELRHCATHDSLPALPLLWKAKDDMLLWLKEAYWDQQSNNQSNLIETIKKCVKDYKISKIDESKNHLQELKKIVNIDTYNFLILEIVHYFIPLRYFIIYKGKK
jgi:hypothetical protein